LFGVSASALSEIRAMNQSRKAAAKAAADVAAAAPPPPPQTHASTNVDLPNTGIGHALPTFQDVCFAAGMPIRTPDGERPIESFEIGDSILSRPEEDPAAPVRITRVEGCFKFNGEVLELHLAGRTIVTTAKHPFFVEGAGWKAAGKLEVGDMLLGERG